MKLYDHISTTNLEASADKKTIKMYVCGPTVYNHVHIGNLRPIITFDVLNRLFVNLGYDVKFAHNITDIDDKIINKAIEENKGELEISTFYEEKYLQILDQINIYKKNMFFPKVSTHIQDIVEYVEKIIANKFAYYREGDVYFDTTKSDLYGMISNKKINELLVGDKSQNNDKKESNQDFVLWKKTNKGLNWDTKISKGRPGWHTECSCMIKKYFGNQVDIHGGGVDLKFPHHENENIQNIAINGNPLARIWMHVGHLNVNNEKMSKSLKNFILAKDLLNTYDSNTVRWFFYQTNYTNPLNFSEKNIKDAQDSIETLINSLNIYKSYLIINNELKAIDKLDQEYLMELINNFNFPNTLTFINKKISEANQLLKNYKFSDLNITFQNLSKLLVDIFGIKYKNIHDQETISQLIDWDTLKKKKNFIESDKLRKLLMDKKIL